MAEGSEARFRGEAAWRAERTATDQRNAAAKARARGHRTASSQAVADRERRLDLLESAQLAALNRKLRASRGV
jgi:hypothetical protein